MGEEEKNAPKGARGMISISYPPPPVLAELRFLFHLFPSSLLPLSTSMATIMMMLISFDAAKEKPPER